MTYVYRRRRGVPDANKLCRNLPCMASTYAKTWITRSLNAKSCYLGARWTQAWLIN